MFNDEWERQNQELLKEWYREKITSRPTLKVRKIICGGCGKEFYTQVDSKKYCHFMCARQGNYKHQRERRLENRKDRTCVGCGTLFTPKRSDAKYCSNACRQRAYRQNVTDTPSVPN